MKCSLAQSDPEISAAIQHEILRQHEGLEMIASENFVSRAVLEVAGHSQSAKISGLRGSRMICLMLTRTETGADEPTDQAKNTRPQ